MRPNGFSTIIVSLHAEHDSGAVILDRNELTNHKWVSLEEAKEFDLLDNLWEQIEVVDRKG